MGKEEKTVTQHRKMRNRQRLQEAHEEALLAEALAKALAKACADIEVPAAITRCSCGDALGQGDPGDGCQACAEFRVRQGGPDPQTKRALGRTNQDLLGDFAGSVPGKGSHFKGFRPLSGPERG